MAQKMFLITTDAQVEKVKVLFDYEKDNSDELTIKVGEVYDIVDKEIQEGWWKVRTYMHNTLNTHVLYTSFSFQNQ